MLDGRLFFLCSCSRLLYLLSPHPSCPHLPPSPSSLHNPSQPVHPLSNTTQNAKPTQRAVGLPAGHRAAGIRNWDPQLVLSDTQALWLECTLFAATVLSVACLIAKGKPDLCATAAAPIVRLGNVFADCSISFAPALFLGTLTIAFSQHLHGANGTPTLTPTATTTTATTPPEWLKNPVVPPVLAIVAVCMPAALPGCLSAWRLLLGRTVRSGAGGGSNGDAFTEPYALYEKKGKERVTRCGAVHRSLVAAASSLLLCSLLLSNYRSIT